MIIDKFMYKKENNEILKKQYLTHNIVILGGILLYTMLFLICMAIAASLDEFNLVLILLAGIILILIVKSIFLIFNEFRVIRINQNDIENKLDRLLKGESK